MRLKKVKDQKFWEGFFFFFWYALTIEREQAFPNGWDHTTIPSPFLCPLEILCTRAHTPGVFLKPLGPGFEL